MAPLVRRNLAQSNMLTHRSITVESKLTSLFLNRNFFLKGASLRQRSSNRKKSFWYSSQGRCCVGIGQRRTFGSYINPHMRKFPFAGR